MSFFDFLKTIFVFLMIFFCIFIGWFQVRADTTSTLRPFIDGGDDSADWKNTAGNECGGGGIDCYLEVDEVACDEDSSYIEGKINGANQTFDIDESSITNNSIITAIDITVCYNEKSGVGINSFQTRRCVDGSCTNSGTDINTGTSYTETTQLHSGLSITKTASTDLEIGVSITDSLEKEIRISQISANITYAVPSPPPPPPPPPPDQDETEEGARKIYIHFSGQAYPGSQIELLAKKEKTGIFVSEPIGKFPALEDGSFEIVRENLLVTKFFFALRAEDKDGRKTGILAFNIDLMHNYKLVVKDIFFPPTVGFENTVVARNQDINIMGYAAPNSKIEVNIDDIKKGETQSDEAGFWSFRTSPLELDFGGHYLRARQINQSGRESGFSFPQAFKISSLKTLKADFNNDDKVNITDWSIFLYRWGSEDESLKSEIDMNDDGNIDIRDLSIFLKMMEI